MVAWGGAVLYHFFSILLSFSHNVVAVGWSTFARGVEREPTLAGDETRCHARGCGVSLHDGGLLVAVPSINVSSSGSSSSKGDRTRLLWPNLDGRKELGAVGLMYIYYRASIASSQSTYSSSVPVSASRFCSRREERALPKELPQERNCH